MHVMTWELAFYAPSAFHPGTSCAFPFPKSSKYIFFIYSFLSIVNSYDLSFSAMCLSITNWVNLSVYFQSLILSLFRLCTLPRGMSIVTKIISFTIIDWHCSTCLAAFFLTIEKPFLQLPTTVNRISRGHVARRWRNRFDSNEWNTKYRSDPTAPRDRAMLDPCELGAYTRISLCCISTYVNFR